MEMIKIEARARDKVKKGACKRYRKQGYIPSVIYGQGKNENILIDSKIFKKLYHKLTRSTVINLTVDKNEYNVLIKDYDKDYIKDEIIHIDFYQLDSKKPVRVSIPIEFVGSSIGIREGGLLEKHLINLEVECLPKDIVQYFQVNIEHLKINDSLHVKDIKLDSRYKILSHPDEVVIRISGVKEEVETTEKGEEGVSTTATQTGEKEKDKDKDKESK